MHDLWVKLWKLGVTPNSVILININCTSWCAKSNVAESQKTWCSAMNVSIECGENPCCQIMIAFDSETEESHFREVR